MKKLILLISFILIFTVGIIGCGEPKGDPAEVLNKYYENIKTNKFDLNYEYLSNASKSNWTEENFKEWLSTQAETSSVKDVKIEKTNEYKNKDLDGINYTNVVEFNITETQHNNYEDKDGDTKYVRNVVNEDGQWKIYRGEEDPKEKISRAKEDLAIMYYYGKGKNKDLNQTAIILNKSIEENPNYKQSYYMLGGVYNELQRYDEAIENEQKYLDKESNDKAKSDAYNILGLAYKHKNNYIKAKEYFALAIEVDPTNEYAKTNLEKLK